MKTKTLLLAVVFTSAIIHHPSSISFAQAPNWAWAQSAGGTFNDEGFSVSTDASGNVFVTGGFYSPAITFGTTTLTNASAGGSDMFLVKYDSAGTVLWAKSAGGISWDVGFSVSTDAGGNVFVTGRFDGPTITFGTTTLTNAGNEDMFIVKYDQNGNVLWAKGAGGTDSDAGNSCSTDLSGNIFVTGSFGSSSITFGTTTLTNAGPRDIFIVKYDPSGNVLWAKSAGGSGNDRGLDCSTDSNGNIFVTGYFFSFSITFGTTTLTNAGWGDIFIVKYDPNGNVLWAKGAGGTDSDAGNSCSTDSNGNIFVTGDFFSSSITFGTTTLNNPSPSYSDIFIVKYDPNGNVLWAQGAGGPFSYYDEGWSCSTDLNGNVFVTGFFASPSITFGTTTLTNTSVEDTSDIFIVKYDSSGNVLWAKSAGGTDWDYGVSCATDTSGNILVTGYFRSDSITFGTTTLTNAGMIDMFIVKLGTTVTGIDEFGISDLQFTIFPNPTSGKFTIQLATGNWQLASSQKQVASIEIYNVLGEKVTQSVIPSGTRNLSVDLSEAPDGIYFICIRAEEGIVTKKFIVSK